MKFFSSNLKYIQLLRIVLIIVILSVPLLIRFIQKHQIETLKFTESINRKPFPFLIVPNIIHYVLFNISNIQFSHYVSILSVLKNQRPELIYIHCNCHQLSGYFYDKVIDRLEYSETKLIIRKIKQPVQIYGKPLNKEWLNWHSADITRLRVLKQFGGIYLDNDVYVVKCLDVFRKFEMTLNWDKNQQLGNQVIIAHKNARFLDSWLQTYHQYNESLWYYNAGYLPTSSILEKNPGLINRVMGQFGVDGPRVCPMVYRIYYPDWKQEFYAIHLVLRGFEISFKWWCFGNDVPPVMVFNETIAWNSNVTFGEMFRDLFKDF